MRFRGLAVPGGAQVQSDSDLVAVWRTDKSGLRFQNYRAVFTVLDVPVVTRKWLDSITPDETLGAGCPDAWRSWIERGTYEPLLAPRTIQTRNKTQQLPKSKKDRAMLAALHEHFAFDSIAFEACAAHLWLMINPRCELTMTRPTRDGGRDAIGIMSLGPESDPIHMEFALEAKCYGPDHGVGVKEVSRLISRLRHRQFGVLVTTSYVGHQAYEEIREDRHPVVILSGADLIEVLRRRGYSSVGQLRYWLNAQFPREK
jgi:hypothetical protein